MASKKSGGWQKLEIDENKNESGFGENKNVYWGIRRRRVHWSGPIWGPFGGARWGPWDPFGADRRGPWDPFGGIVGEAEGRHYGGRRPTKWGSGDGDPQENGAHSGPCSTSIILSVRGMGKLF